MFQELDELTRLCMFEWSDGKLMYEGGSGKNSFPWYGQVKNGKPWGQGYFIANDGEKIFQTMKDGGVHGY